MPNFLQVIDAMRTHHAAAQSGDFLKQLVDQPLKAVTDYYATRLPENAKACKFLTRKALSADNSSEQLGLGFSDRTLGNHIPKKTLKEGQAIRNKLASLGVYRPNGREHFRGMVTVPLYWFIDNTPTVTGIYGLRIDMSNGGEREQTIGSGIFNAQALSKFEEVIVCDQILDAWALVAAGHKHAICAVDYCCPEHIAARTKRILLASPQVDAEPFAHCESFALCLPPDCSIHQYALEHQQEPDPLSRFLRGAPWLKAAAPEPKSEPPKKPATSPVPALPEDDLAAEVSETEVTIAIESRCWRIRNLQRNKLPGVLRVNVMVHSANAGSFHVDTFDLYHARSRRSFLSEAAEELGEVEEILRVDLGRVLLKLEELQRTQQPASDAQAKRTVPELSAEEREAALELLRSENLFERILEDFDHCGLVGEQHGKLIGYLAATSRLLAKPLGLIVQSSSAAGKSSLTGAVLRFMPEEALVECSAMTSQSLYYLGQQDLQHRILSIAEEEGIRDASYGLKLLQSEGRLSLISTTREKGTGRLITQRYEVHGPVALILTTTASDLDPELLNRCLVITVDESELQTTAILAQQRFARTFPGFQQKQQTRMIARLHQNAQRLLKPLQVHNPYASQLTFAGAQTRFRRDHEKYLTLIHTICLLHQYQRETQTTEVDGQEVSYLEVTRSDIAAANRIAHWALGRSIDELPGPTRRLLGQLFEWTRIESKQQRVSASEFTFTRRQARETLRWNATHFREHLERLVQAEYVVPHGRGRGKLHRYSLLYGGSKQDGRKSLLGLVEADVLVDPKPESMMATWHSFKPLGTHLAPGPKET